MSAASLLLGDGALSSARATKNRHLTELSVRIIPPLLQTSWRAADREQANKVKPPLCDSLNRSSSGPNVCGMVSCPGCILRGGISEASAACGWGCGQTMFSDPLLREPQTSPALGPLGQGKV